MGYDMKRHGLVGLLLGLLVVVATSAYGEGKVFHIIGKNMDDENFIQVYLGCQQEARKNGDRCIHLGPSSRAHFRDQNSVLEETLNSGSDGIALSVTNGPFLASHALYGHSVNNPPLVTFDSDFPEQLQYLRLSYIGPDNVAIGKQLAALLVSLNQSGGSFCLMTADARDTNLEQRMQGVRDHLATTGLWTEAFRCPWITGDSIAQALTQVRYTLHHRVASALISVGSWPILSLKEYRHAVQQYRSEDPDSPTIVVATGHLRSGDCELLTDNYVDGLVSIDFRAMGQEVYRALSELASGAVIAEQIATPVHSVSPATSDDADTWSPCRR